MIAKPFPIHGPLSRKVAAWVGGTIVVLFTLSCTIYAGWSHLAARRHMQAEGASLADAFLSSNIEALLARDYPLLESAARLFRERTPALAWVELRGKDGRVLASSGSREGAGRAIVVRRPARFSRETLGELEIGLSTAARTREIARLSLLVVAIGFWIAAITGLCVYLLLRQLVLEPVAQLHRLVRELGEGRLESRLMLPPGDELGELAEGLNLMAAALEKARASSAAQLKLTQSMLLQSEKMSAVGQLAAGIAHELNNPLGVILGFVQGSQRKSGHGLAEELAIIERETLRCRDLVRSMLTFARAGRDDARADEDAERLLRESLRLATVRTRPQQIVSALDVEPGLPRLRVNVNQIQQVLVNLCNNALDAMPKGGTLLLRARRAPEGMIELQVCDTGVGIPPALQSRVFEPFFTTKEIGKGTGLGLSLSYELVAKHGGAIRLESAPGGTTFFVLLPAAQSPAAAPART